MVAGGTRTASWTCDCRTPPPIHLISKAQERLEGVGVCCNDPKQLTVALQTARYSTIQCSALSTTQSE